MRIVIDLQGAQTTGSRNRGIGRYSLSLALAIARNRGKHDIHLVLNGLFPETIPSIREAFGELIPQSNIHVWQTASPVAELDASNTKRRLEAQSIRETFLASLQPDIILVTSLLEGLSDDAVTSIGHFLDLPTAVILYDLIPLIHEKIYLTNPVLNTWYRGKIEQLKRANLLLAISASSGQEAVDYLEFDPSRVTNISTAGEPHFRPIDISARLKAELSEKYRLNRSFVMYTGGIDHRKNIEGLIRAYAKLDPELRKAYQLAIVCSVQHADKKRLLALGAQMGLQDGDLVLTGYVPEDDLLALYNTCTLFVFPSWHEGFGLPALEAMSCGKAVIAANTSSLPEVMGNPDALFDPHDDLAIRDKITQVLRDEPFRRALEQHGLIQAKKFDWNQSALHALAAMEAWHKQRPAAVPIQPCERKPQLAYISPLPPEHSGISDYSAELLPVLAAWYDIDVIVDQAEVSDPWIRENCPIRNIPWFREHHAIYDRVIYHFGNSHFHQHMFDLLEQHPGVVVLHDFYLSGILAHLELSGQYPDAWACALLHSHGYTAVQARETAPDASEVIWQYPANLQVLQNALGIIIHSKHSRRLAQQWYGTDAARECIYIPLLRAPEAALDRAQARTTLGLQDTDILICSFGIIGPTKLNHRLLEAFLASSMRDNPSIHLVFVGQNDAGDYGQKLFKMIKDSGLHTRIRITGWADQAIFRNHLAAADIGVQLRTYSRGETSAAVLDCMNYALPTIVNANGSMADLDPEAVWLMPDEFTDDELIHALDVLGHNPSARHALGQKAKQVIATYHDPKRCAQQYAQAIEAVHNKPKSLIQRLVNHLAPNIENDREFITLASHLASNFPPSPRRNQWLMDISALLEQETNAGIQRAERATLREWIENPPDGFQVEPIYTTANEPGYRYARQLTSQLLGMQYSCAHDDPAEAWSGDVFIGLDSQYNAIHPQRNLLQEWRNRGVDVQLVAEYLSPTLMPQARSLDPHSCLPKKTYS